MSITPCISLYTAYLIGECIDQRRERRERSGYLCAAAQREEEILQRSVQ